MLSITRKDTTTPDLANILKKAQYLVYSRPSEFALHDASNNWHSSVIARTNLGEACSGVELSLEISKRPDGVTQSLCIIAGEEKVYRLDEISGKDAEHDRQSLLNILNDETTKISPQGTIALQTMIERGYRTGDNGQVLHLTDNFAETQLQSVVVDELLDKANARLPKLRQGEVRLSEAVTKKKFKLFG